MTIFDILLLLFDNSPIPKSYIAGEMKNNQQEVAS